MATANAMACITEGVNIVQGTINGLGERAGNTPLEEVIMTIAVHPDEYPVKCKAKPSELYELSQLVTRLTGVEPAVTKAVIGRNIFRSEAGVHQDGLLKDAHVYLPFLPEQMGAPGLQLVLGKHSGRRAVAHCAANAGVTLDDEQTTRVLEHLKRSPLRRSYESKSEVLGLLDEVFPDRNFDGLDSGETSEDWAEPTMDGSKPR
jgi:2-isopropylmalate synthase